MKFKKVSMLLLGGLLVTALSGCSLQEIKAWVKQNVVQPARSVLDPVLNPGQQEEPKKEDEKKDDQKPDQGGDQGGEGEHGGEGEGGGEQTKNSYTITFQNYDETVLQSGKVEEGELPVYAGEEPTREGDAQYSYSFDGWDKEIVAATADATYTATFTQSVNEYTVKFLNYDDSELQSEKLAYGAMPEYKGAEPTKPETDAATFAFAGWDHEIAAVTGDATYKATFNAVTKEYTVKFMNGEQVLQEDKVAYGQTPEYTGVEPTKEQTAQYTYAFSGWQPTLGPVTGDATYQAQFSETLRQYQVTFDSKGGSEVASVMVDYGAHVPAPAEPSKDADAEHIYFFDGWELNGVAFDFANAVVEGPLTLEAKWDAVSATEHAHRCTYTHYAANAPGYVVDAGYNEFWMCELHHSYVMAQPSQGTVNEATEPFEGEILETDPRYVAPLAGNAFARLQVKGWQDGALLYSNDVYNNIENITFKMRITGAVEEMGSIWTAIGISNGHGDWDGLDNNFFTKVADGEWHLYTRKMNGQSGYVNMCYNMDHKIDAFIEFDDIRIETSTGVVVETFDEDTCLFGFDTAYAGLAGEKKDNNFARLTINPIYDDDALLYTFAQYSEVTNVSFKLRVNGSTAKSWEGAAVNTDAYGDDQYTNMIANDAYNDDGAWHYRTFDFASKTGYVNLINEIGHLECSSLDIDDIAIIYDGGKVAYETFDDGLVLFGTPAQLQRVMIKSEAKAEAASLGALALDTVNGALENREYSTVYTQSKGTDATYGPYIQIDDWACAASQNRCWLGFASEALPEGQTRIQLEGAGIANYFFYMYNPLAEEFKIHLQFDHHYTDISTLKLAPQAWTKVTVPHGAWGSYQLTDPSKIGFDHFFTDNGSVCGSGFKVTSIYAEPVVPSANPAPFGVVALDAQTGYFRDTKGYNAPHTDSHGIDAEYGAYIQIDDWACPSGANQCWITFSDTARDVADIEADLGGAIQNYFFYIYNPLADSFTFKIMLKSSSGMNPNMTVACASHAWTKVTIAYGQADSGTYPALTSASQIGLTQVLGNGVAVGSGWKVTSVYAE